jgi:hypothetical protein
LAELLAAALLRTCMAPQAISLPSHNSWVKISLTSQFPAHHHILPYLALAYHARI